ncbi:MAG: NAD(P)H-dependent oxidoreductase [Rickettsiales bacterium]|nr:NAD(P)H-dependent oxidoreductase [Rickettsiales bacterium]
MTNLLVVCGHTDLKNSVANKAILENLRKEFPSAEIDELITLYPDYKFNVRAEQDKLVKADVIVLQFPMFWYNCPSIMRKWFEDVLLYGFAYGSNGKALESKKVIVSFTTGAPFEKYRYGEMQNFEIGEFMPSFIQLTNLCGMKWSGYICTGGYTFTSEDSTKRNLISEHVNKLVEKIKSL